MNIKLKKRELRERIKNLNSYVLREYSKLSTLVHYQGDRTKTGLSEALREIHEQSRNAERRLTQIDNIVTHLETVQNFGDEGLVDLYYKQGDEDINTFIRIQRDNGWSESDILIALEMEYDRIKYATSREMQNWEMPTDEMRIQYFEGAGML